MADDQRTLYALVDFTGTDGTDHKRGDSVQFAKSDRQASELLRRGVLSMKPVRRQSGESQK